LPSSHKTANTINAGTTEALFLSQASSSSIGIVNLWMIVRGTVMIYEIVLQKPFSLEFLKKFFILYATRMRSGASAAV
jgi:hypothetical protein